MGFDALMQAITAQLPELEGKLHLETVRYHADTQRALISFLSDELIGEERFFAIKKQVAKALPRLRFSLRIASPSLAEDFLKQPAAHADVLTAIITRAHPAAVSWLPEIRFLAEQDGLVLEFPDQFSLDYFRQRELSKLLQTAIQDVFRVTPLIQLRLRDDVQTRVKRIQADRQAEQESLRRQAEGSQAKASKKPRANTAKAMRIKGSAIAEPPVPLSGLSEVSGRVTVAGKIVSLERRDIPGKEMVLISFVLTDYSNSISCKLFLRYRNQRFKQEGEPKPPTAEETKQLEDIVAQLQVGQGIKLRGNCQIDSFEHHLVIMVQDVARYDLVERQDDAEHKRIELHAHTTMSAMDATMSAKALIERAAVWGHSAIAITDHGVVQAYPEAFAAAKAHNIRLIPGLEAYMIDSRPVLKGDGERDLHQAIVVVDFETTGLNTSRDRIIEVGAVKLQGGQIVDSFSTLVNPGVPLPAVITRITGITDGMLLDAPRAEAVLPQLLQFIGDSPLAAHNAAFDCAVLESELGRLGQTRQFTRLDTLYFAQKLYPQLKRYRLASVCKHLGVSLKNAHRAVHDATATAQVLAIMLAEAQALGAELLSDIDRKLTGYTKGQDYHVVVLAKNQRGLQAINSLVSMAHLQYFYYVPKVPREQIAALRADLLLGSACSDGELYQALLNDEPDETLFEIARFYDYLEVQPVEQNQHLVANGKVVDREALIAINQRIIDIGEQLAIPVVATGDAHYLDPQDAIFRSILQHSQRMDIADLMLPQHLRTTEEMLDCFSWLPEEKARELVITNPARMLEHIEAISLYPKHPEGKTTFAPTWQTAAEDIQQMALQRARDLYGDPLPELVQKRLDKELAAIIGYGYATLYSIANKLVARSLEDGYLVGSRGSVGSSLVATMCQITEVNPLPPHYRCAACAQAHFDVPTQYTVGIDLPDKACPACGEQMLKDGFDIPFEVFLGFKGDKVPDIDLNFSGEYQATAHAYVEELFGKGYVYRAGTIGTLQERTAYGLVLKYMEDRGLNYAEAERQRLVQGCTGVKRTTGQHPGGIVLLPKEYDINQFTAVQHPADDADSGIITTHYDFSSMHHILVKLDILGHDDPTMIYRLERLTGVPFDQVPLDDSQVMSLFLSPEALGLQADQIDCPTGTLGIPEFGTPFVRQMLADTKPRTMEELIRISGLSHGTNVWLGNAKDLIDQGTATLRECICTRDDIMNALMLKGLEPKMAFDIMERVRKGHGLKPEMEGSMRDHGVPEWFISSCNKIAYMFPKGHAVAYVIMALRVAWYKVYHPLAYYAAYFSIRGDGFDAGSMLRPAHYLKEMLAGLAAIDPNLITGVQKQQIVALEVVLEMLARGIQLLPPDLYRSDAEQFLIEGEALRVPFMAISGFGQAAARSILDSRDEPYISIEDLKQRTKVTSTVLDQLREHGALKGLSDTNQVDFFSFL